MTNSYFEQEDFEVPIVDTGEEDEEVVPSRYDITSYGVDFDVEGLVRRIQREDILIPEFQRNFVWTLPESSKFVESLLLGLPVPGIFLAQEQDTGKMSVIDGQQRLLTLKFFLEGFFDGSRNANSRRVFKLNKVQPQFDGKSFDDLDNKDRNNLENSVIHATVVKQDSPADDDTSIYHIFERLNSGGRNLSAHEIRCAVYHGSFIDFLKILNQFDAWRKIFGSAPHNRMRDQELILRFFAMYYNSENYQRPMAEFLNRFLNQNRYICDEKRGEFSILFKRITKLFYESVPAKPFRVGRALNVAFFDAAMVGLAKRVTEKDQPNPNKIHEVHNFLLHSSEFNEQITQSTAGINSVQSRISIATRAFMDV